MLIRLLLTAIISAAAGGVLGSFLPNFTWTLFISAALVVGPPLWYMVTDPNPAHPGKIGAVIANTATILGGAVGIWAGYLLF